MGPSLAQRLAQYQAAMQYFGADDLGSVRQIFDASAQVIGSRGYEPFGGFMGQSGTATSVYGFAGEQDDSYIKLLYLRARWYDDGTGRFTQPDPIIPDYGNPQSINRYPYVWNNPVSYIDPTGRWRCEDRNDLRCAENTDEKVEVCTNADCKQPERVNILLEVATDLLDTRVQSDADFLINMTDAGAKLSHDDANKFVDDLTLVIMGYHMRDAMDCGLNRTACETDGRATANNLNKFYQLQTDLDPRVSGLYERYQDPWGKGQVHHFWEYVATSYWNGWLLATGGNLLHENPLENGASWQDLDLGQAGVCLGAALMPPDWNPTESRKPALRPGEVARWIESVLVDPQRRH